jgi:TMEM175 potassium channel family protein
MDTSYNQVAGQSVERLAALSDGIFGVAMTLLLLELHVPGKELIHSEGDLRSALARLAPQLLVYLMSFLTLGIFWVGQQTQLNHLAHSERHFTWIQLAFLFVVTIMPFSTRLLTEFIDYRTALLAYWANIFLLGAMLYLSWSRATRAGLIKSDTSPQIVAAIRRRIWTAQSFYAFGALLCVFHPYWSIGFIVLMQLYYAVAPRYGRSQRREEA